jgi:hypothetical protein
MKLAGPADGGPWEKKGGALRGDLDVAPIYLALRIPTKLALTR